MKKLHFWVGILGIMTLLMTAGCGHPHQNQSLHGAYKFPKRMRILIARVIFSRPIGILRKMAPSCGPSRKQVIVTMVIMVIQDEEPGNL
jgi:hypothetical protein